MKSFLSQKFFFHVFISSFIVICSILWMTSVLPVSPFYFVVIPIFFYPFYAKYNISRQNYTTLITYLVLCLMFLYLLVQPLFSDSSVHNNYVLAFCFLFYIFCDSILYSLKSKESYINIVKCLSTITIVYMFCDFLKRVFSINLNNIPAWIAENPIFRFYLFKGEGLHGDSNNSAAICLVVLLFLYFYRNFIAYKTSGNKRFSVLFFILFICLCSTFSRAAIISFFFILLFNHLFYRHGTYAKLFCVFVALMCALCLFYILSIDPSGKTKLSIFENTWSYLWTETSPVKIIFGYGGNQSISVLGLYAHNPISVYLIEYGLIGFVLYLAIFFFLFLDVGSLSLFILLPYFVFALSFSPLHTTYLFAALSMVKHAKRIFGIRWKK